MAAQATSEHGVEEHNACISCETVDDLVLPSYEGDPPLCRECRAPLRTLDFPELYCDLGEGD